MKEFLRLPLNKRRLHEVLQKNDEKIKHLTAVIMRISEELTDENLLSAEREELLKEKREAERERDRVNTENYKIRTSNPL